MNASFSGNKSPHLSHSFGADLLRCGAAIGLGYVCHVVIIFFQKSLVFARQLKHVIQGCILTKFFITLLNPDYTQHKAVRVENI